MLPHSSKILLLCISRTIGSPSGGKSSPSCAYMALGVWDSQLAPGSAKGTLDFHQCWVVLGWDPCTHPTKILSPRATSLVLSEGGDEGHQGLVWEWGWDEC